MKLAGAVFVLRFSVAILILHFEGTIGKTPVQVVVPQGIESVNGSDINMGCTSPLVDSGDGVMVCSSDCSTLLDGISPTIDTSTSDWASQLVTVRKTEHEIAPFSRVLLTFGFDTAVTVTRIELDLFLCPEWNIGAPEITVYANGESNLDFSTNLPSQTIILSDSSGSSCDSLSTVTILLRETLTRPSFLTWHTLMSQFGDAEWAHIGEVRFVGADIMPNSVKCTVTSTPIPTSSVISMTISYSETFNSTISSISPIRSTSISQSSISYTSTVISASISDKSTSFKTPSSYSLSVMTNTESPSETITSFTITPVSSTSSSRIVKTGDMSTSFSSASIFDMSTSFKTSNSYSLSVISSTPTDPTPSMTTSSFKITPVSSTSSSRIPKSTSHTPDLSTPITPMTTSPTLPSESPVITLSTSLREVSSTMMVKSSSFPDLGTVLTTSITVSSSLSKDPVITSTSVPEVGRVPVITLPTSLREVSSTMMVKSSSFPDLGTVTTTSIAVSSIYYNITNSSLSKDPVITSTSVPEVGSDNKCKCSKCDCSTMIAVGVIAPLLVVSLITIIIVPLIVYKRRRAERAKDKNKSYMEVVPINTTRMDIPDNDDDYEVHKVTTFPKNTPSNIYEVTT